MKVTNKSICDEQGGFGKGRGYVMYLGKDRELNAALMDLEKAYDMVDKKGLRIHNVGGPQLEGIWTLLGYKCISKCKQGAE